MPIRSMPFISEAWARFALGMNTSEKPWLLAVSTILMTPGMGRRVPSRESSPTKILPVVSVCCN